MTLMVLDTELKGRLIAERQPSPEARAALQAIHHRSVGALLPVKGRTMSLAYRRRVFSLDRWQLWPRLTRYRTWAGPEG